MLPTVMFLALFLTLQLSILANLDFKVIVILVMFPIMLFKNKNKLIFESSSNSLTKINQFMLILFSVMVVYVVINSFINPYRYFAVKNISWFLSSLLGFFLVSHAPISKDTIKSFLHYFVLFISIASIYVIGEYFGYLPDQQLRSFPVEVTGHVGHKSTFSILAVLALLSSLHLIKEHKNNRYIPFLILIGFALLIADSRVPLFLAVLGISAYLVPYIVKSGEYRSKKFWILSFTLLIVIVSIPVLVWGSGISARFAGLFNIHAEVFRMAMYEGQISMIKDAPFFGHGLGSVSELIFKYYPDWYKISFNHNYASLSGHCEYLQRFAELGILGASIYFFFWVGAIIIAVKSLKKQWCFLDYLFLLALILLMIETGYQETGVKPPVAIILWMLLGWFWSKQIPNGFCIYRLRNNKPFITPLASLLIIVAIPIIVSVVKLQLSEFYYTRGLSPDSFLGKNHSVKEFNKAISVFPEHIYATQKLLENQFMERKMDSVISGIEKFERFSPYFIPMNSLKGRAYLEKGQPEKALEIVRLSLKNHSKNMDELVVKAQALSQLGKSDELHSLLVSMGVYSNGPVFFPKTDSELSAYDERFYTLVGPLRSVIGGPWLRTCYDAYFQKNYRVSHGNFQTLEILKKLEIPEQK